ncbi:hypothetical protein A2U01_0000201 [Trifolium medium]|uniref:Uncharacterized protein n=1 Tax=Trifolium medium TaxID=97028 RepID=A0A392LWX3_9FABA|nr:hypothetical protein [Trifolium medium]
MRFAEDDCREGRRTIRARSRPRLQTTISVLHAFSFYGSFLTKFIKVAFVLFVSISDSSLLVVGMTLNVHFHHGGQFVDDYGTYVGSVYEKQCDSEVWGYFEIVDIITKLGYFEIGSILYDFAGQLKPLTNDFDAIEAANWARTTFKVDVYVVHTITQPYYVNMDEAQPEPMAENENEAQPKLIAQPHNEEAQLESEVESEDSAVDVRFGDFEDEVGLHDEVGLNVGLNDTGGVVNELDDDVQGGAGSKKQKNKGGRPKKNVDGAPSKKRKGRPKKNVAAEQQVEVTFSEEESDEETLNLRKKEKMVVESDEDYKSEELVSDVDSDNESEEGSKMVYPSFVMPKSMEDYKWEKGTKFSSKAEFMNAVATYAIHNGKDIKFGKNDKIRCRAMCKGGCKWFLFCSKLPDEDTWQIRTKNDTHSCILRDYNVKLLNSKWLGKRLVPTVKENPNIKCSSICTKAHQKWHAGISRMKSYRAKRAAIKMVDGSFKEQFLRLHDYCNEVIKSNPLSTVKLNVQNTDVVEGQDIIVQDYVDRPILPSFQRLYMCLDGCKQSFFKCRPVIGLDGCFLKGYYGGQILAAVGRDPNDQILPIALSVVEAETKDSWAWFLDLLVNDLGGPRLCKTFTFISDQQKGLLPAMEELLSGVEHRFCVRHLYNNFRKKFPRKKIKDMMWKTALASYAHAWQREMKEIKATNDEAFKYLIKIPPRHRSKSYFTFNSKCDTLVNNMCETFNSIIIEPRQKPIVTMLEEIKGYFMSRWTTNRSKFDHLPNGSVLPNIKKRMEIEQQSCRFWFCRLAGQKIYDVVSIRTSDVITEKYVVDLNKMECTCRK